ncbi:histidine phosphatase family protein [Chitinophaga pinensis]|uniref:Phosphoglycerate mutase n=1 Tax=Chitinophaga pinensis (strain ATCC 43595 / DSM 2588 / LMG 13176 / NBRC 15968 / NCIMB 11800 / UQM 2034) TaxID=485918 RepID=A0A979G780_CHIPD|nr:histidine phosphatase family protein [Chitinophaga pinensis]ACU61928.1 Phosphoglycerate mutase [Chitinophaga pinensis DSM 2588]
MELHLIRHIKPDYPEGHTYGQTDVPLPADYAITHAGIIERLPDHEVLYSSPLTRCKLLATAINPNHLTDARLMELNFGDWEGRKWDEIDRKELDPWMEDYNYINSAPPNGESLMTLVNRFADFVHELKQMPYERALLITHAGVIRSAMYLFNNVPLQEMMMQKVEYGGIYRFTA